MSIKFIHCADIHLGSPLKANSEEKSELINNAIEKALENMVQLAINEEVDFVTIAGDLFDGKITNATLGRKFLRIMEPLKENHIYSYILFGNHDAQGKHDLTFSNNDFMKFFSAQEAETFLIEDKEIAIHGHSFETQAVYENLSKNYPAKKEGYFNIGVLHTSLAGADGHDNYAPCSVSDLKNKNYDYWALGHIHKCEVVNESNPPIIFSGNIQGRHTNETGNKGCYLVNIDSDHKVSYEFKKLNSIIFLDIELDIKDFTEMEDLKEKLRENIPQEQIDSFLNLTLTGQTQLHYNINLEDLKLSLDSKVELVKLKNKTTYPKTAEEIAAEENTIGYLMKGFEKDTLRAELENIKREVFDNIMKNFGDELKSEFDFDELESIQEIVLEQLQKANS